jgi:hypothetical protein
MVISLLDFTRNEDHQSGGVKGDFEKYLFESVR